LAMRLIQRPSISCRQHAWKLSSCVLLDQPNISSVSFVASTAEYLPLSLIDVRTKQDDVYRYMKPAWQALHGFMLVEMPMPYSMNLAIACTLTVESSTISIR
jgi:hypothetical protein